MYAEGPLDFGPTYKYQPGTDLYEQREDKKKRVPAWYVYPNYQRLQLDRLIW